MFHTVENTGALLCNRNKYEAQKLTKTNAQSYKTQQVNTESRFHLTQFVDCSYVPGNMLGTMKKRYEYERITSVQSWDFKSWLSSPADFSEPGCSLKIYLCLCDIKCVRNFLGSEMSDCLLELERTKVTHQYL